MAAQILRAQHHSPLKPERETDRSRRFVNHKPFRWKEGGNHEEQALHRPVSGCRPYPVGRHVGPPGHGPRGRLGDRLAEPVVHISARPRGTAIAIAPV